MIYFSKDTIQSKASEYKINIESSTETKLLGLKDFFPFELWIGYFLEKQGYKLKSNIVYQDNMSTIKMERNGHNFCTRNSRHIDLRFFRQRQSRQKINYVTSLFYRRNAVRLQYETAPRKDINKFRNLIMIWADISILRNDDKDVNDDVSTSKEHAGNEDRIVKNKNQKIGPKKINR